MKKFLKIIVGVILLLIFAIVMAGVVHNINTISVSEAKDALYNNPQVVSSKQVEAKVISVKQVPLYGYSTDIGHGLFIVSFSEPAYEKGDKIFVHITGAFKMADSKDSSYLLNAWTE